MRRPPLECCSNKQLHTAALLLLLTMCSCTQHVRLTAAHSMSLSTDITDSSSKRQQGRHIQQDSAIGDDDDFDWSKGSKTPAAPTAPSQPKQQLHAPVGQQAVQDKAQDKAAAGLGGKDQLVPQQQVSAQPITEPKDAAAAAAQQTKESDGSQPRPAEQQQHSSQPTASTDAAADSKAPTEEQQQLDADAAAAAHGADADGALNEPVPYGAPAMLGDHAVAAEQQRGPSMQQGSSGSTEQPPPLQQQQQQGTGGAWVSGSAQAPAEQDDINPLGVCQQWVQQYCEDVDVGGGQLADCLAEHQAAADSEEAGDKLQPLSAECHEEVLQVKIWRSKSLDSNPALAKACADDISKYCNLTWFAGANSGHALGCLKERRPKLRPACQKEVFKVQLDAAEDFRADAVLHKACQADAESLCPGVKHGGGQIQACLKKQRPQLSSDCEYELFRKEAEDAGDIRLSVRLFRVCLPDKKRFCADVPPGQALASQCLEEHRESLSELCRDEVDDMTERRVRDFRLDTRLRASCGETILEMCSEVADAAVGDTGDEAVANCLQDFSDDIKDDACRAQVHMYQELAAQDIRFNPPLADACYKDRMELCAQVPPGSARVIRCLQNQRDKLSAVCRSTLMSEEARFSETIDFQYPMKQACKKEIEQFCDFVPHGGGRVIRCLQDHMNQKGFSKPCMEEVQRYQQESMQDIRLNHRLFRACKEDVGAVCAEACDLKQGEVCGGKVLACLLDKREQLRSSTCKKEVWYLQHMGVQDFRADMQLAEACRPDVSGLCAGVEPGEGRVHKCLRDNYEQLSQACKHEEVRLEAQEADNIQLNQGLLRACAAERSLFCRDVQPGSARVFRCLVYNMASADFGSGCRAVLLRKLRRREANWRLDPPLRKACSADVESFCAAEDASMLDGAVKRCMIAQADDLAPGCRRELGRSLYMAFFTWQPQGLLTAPCDADVQRLCPSRVKEMAVMPGVEVCLSEIVGVMRANDLQTSRNLRRLLDRQLAADSKATSTNKAQHTKQQQGKQQTTAPAVQLPSSNTTVRYMPRLSEECYQLALLARLPQSERSSDFAAAAYSLLETSLGRVQVATGLQMLQQDSITGQAAVSLTGWTALAGITSLALLLLAVATWAVRQYSSPSRDGYSVVKGAATC